MKKVWIVTAIVVVGIGVPSLSADDGYGKNRYQDYQVLGQMGEKRGNDPSAVLYKTECASCHMAYQPEFLPQRSWKKMMKGLQDHFGVDATVEPEDQKQLLVYLQENAADAKRTGRIFSKFSRSILSGSTPLRVTELPEFRREHREIPARLIKQEKVKSLSNCLACHRGAERGMYGERDILISNYGRWDD